MVKYNKGWLAMENVKMLKIIDITGKEYEEMKSFDHEFTFEEEKEMVESLYEPSDI